MSSFVVRQARSFALTLAVVLLVIAQRLFAVQNGSPIDNLLDPAVWAWLFVAAGVTTALYALNPTSRRLLALSGALTVSAMLSRAFATLLAITEASDSLTSPQLHIAGMVWTALGVACAYVWSTDFRAVTNLLHYRK